jgi:glucose-6-phosphate isomerase
MNYSNRQLWDRFQKYYSEFPELDLALDLSRKDFADDFLKSMQSRLTKAFSPTASLEQGALANWDENRMVGFYWHRNTDNILSYIRDDLSCTLAVVISNSGGTKGIRNGMLEIEAGDERLELDFRRHVIAIISHAIELVKTATCDEATRRDSQGFLQGTRTAHYESGRGSLTLLITSVSAFSVSVLIALFEGSAGLYADLVNANAYHQPRVEAWKKAAWAINSTQTRILNLLAKSHNRALVIVASAERIGQTDEAETVSETCEHLAVNADRRIVKHLGQSPFDARHAHPAARQIIAA